jgi:hypothetical protein
MPLMIVFHMMPLRICIDVELGKNIYTHVLYNSPRAVQEGKQPESKNRNGKGVYLNTFKSGCVVAWEHFYLVSKNVHKEDEKIVVSSTIYEKLHSTYETNRIRTIGQSI